MVVHTDAGGQRQRFKDTPFVFQEQGILACRRTAAGAARQVDRIFQLIVTPFAAEGQQLVDFAQRQHVFPSTALLSEVIGLLPGFLLSTFSP
jgi:hypothetical protein